jgi:hypothetical protein
MKLAMNALSIPASRGGFAVTAAAETFVGALILYHWPSHQLPSKSDGFATGSSSQRLLQNTGEVSTCPNKKTGKTKFALFAAIAAKLR